jgi:hypothetical protein
LRKSHSTVCNPGFVTQNHNTTLPPPPHAPPLPAQLAPSQDVRQYSMLLDRVARAPSATSATRASGVPSDHARTPQEQDAPAMPHARAQGCSLCVIKCNTNCSSPREQTSIGQDSKSVSCRVQRVQPPSGDSTCRHALPLAIKALRSPNRAETASQGRVVVRW